MMSEEQSQETRIALMKQDIDAMREDIRSLKSDRTHALRWGIITLGTTVMGMSAWIVNLFSGGHIK